MYQIRPVRLEDLDALASMYSYYALNTVTTYCDHAVTPQYMNALLRGPGHYCFVAVCPDGSIAGYLHLTPMFSFIGKKYEVAIYLMPEHTGRGLGRRMVLYGEEFAASVGARHLAVSVCTENAPSLGLFDSLGYRRTRIKVAAGIKFDRYLDTQLFEKSLDQG
ncbi:MAG: GNAT family N-acetyltransferase [Clostridiales bacterium]|nr:GNAT family N-acetyltransferase [Clostridiales bacterium]